MENKIYQKEYYQANKEKLLDRLKQKTICNICGGSYSYVSKNRHMESEKHKKKLNNVNNIDEDSKNMIETLRQKGFIVIPN